MCYGKSLCIRLCVQLHKISESVPISGHSDLPCVQCIFMCLDWAETLVMNINILTQMTSVIEISVRSYLVVLLTAAVVRDI